MLNFLQSYKNFEYKILEHFIDVTVAEYLQQDSQWLSLFYFSK